MEAARAKTGQMKANRVSRKENPVFLSKSDPEIKVGEGLQSERKIEKEEEDRMEEERSDQGKEEQESSLSQKST